MGGHGHGEIPPRQTVCALFLSLFPFGRPWAESAIAPWHLPRRCAPGARLQKATEQAPHARAGQTLRAPAVLEPGAQRDSSLPRVRLDTRIRIRAYGYAHIRARDLKLQIQKLNFQF